jgi:hypothetical protein
MDTHGIVSSLSFILSLTFFYLSTASSQSGNLSKRPALALDPLPAKRSRTYRDEDDDGFQSDRESNRPVPPPVFRTSHARNPSTQTPSVNASRPARASSSNPDTSLGPDFRVTPVPLPQPLMPASQTSASSQSAPRVRPAPQPRPNPPAPNTDTETETETDSETEHKPLPGPRAAQQPRPAARPPATANAQPRERAAPVPAPAPPPTSESCTRSMPHRGPNNGSSGPRPPPAGLEGVDLESALEWATYFVEERMRGTSAAGPSGSAGQPNGPLTDLRARLQTAARSRMPQQVRQHSCYPPIEQPPPATTDPDIDMLPQNEELVNALAAAASGTRPVCNLIHLDDVIKTGFEQPTTPAKTGLGKYPGVRHRVVTTAILELLATACKKGVYQDTAVYRKWAQHAYRHCWETIALDVPYERPPDDLITTVRGNTVERSLRLTCI